MQILIIGSESQKAELTTPHNAIWCSIDDASRGARHGDHLIDLEFDGTEERLSVLEATAASILIINSVARTLNGLQDRFVRINGWPGFLKAGIWEACAEISSQEPAAKTLSQLGKKVLWVKDVPGFVTARVIAMIINEAYLTWESGVSTKEDIDLAMKTGTNYPFGPFEWAQKIGLKRIAELMHVLTAGSPSYAPAASLLKETAS